MFVVAEESSANEDSVGNIVIVSEVWLTPHKSESFWPNTKLSAQYNKLLQRHEQPAEDWSIIKLKRIFFETDDILLARRKAKEAEKTSDVTDGEEIISNITRKRKRTQRLISSDDKDIFNIHRSQILPKPLIQIFENSGSVQPLISNDHSINQVRESNSTNKDTEPAQLTDMTTPIRNIGSGIQPCLFNNSTTVTPAPSIETLSAYEHKSLRLLTTIVEQNNQILSWIRNQNESNTKNHISIDLPVEFPLHQEDELKTLETYLEDDNNFTELCNYFTTFAAISRTGTVNTILKHCLTNKLASKFSYRGKKGKFAFEHLTLKSVIIRTVKRMFKLPIEKKIKNDLKIWLKHAPQRLANQEKNKQNKSQQLTG